MKQKRQLMIAPIKNILEIISLCLISFAIYFAFYRFMILKQAMLESSLLIFTFISLIVFLLMNIIAFVISLVSYYTKSKSNFELKLYSCTKLLVKLVLVFSTIIGLTIAFKKQPMHPVDQQNDLPFYTLLEVMDGEYDSYENGILPSDLSSLNLNQTSTFFTPSNLYLNENTEFKSDTTTRDIMYKISYHECRNEIIAKILYQDLIDDFKTNNGFGYEVLEKYHSYDQCIYIKDLTFVGARVMIIQNGTTVAKVYIKVELDSNFDYVDEIMNKAISALQI